MKRIQPTENEQHWPRVATASIETRKRDLVIRISDWTRDREEPAYDVEVYIGGVYDWSESRTLSVNDMGRSAAKSAAIKYAQDQIVKLL